MSVFRRLKLTKTKKTALLMAEAYDPTSYPSSLALESTLSRSLEAQYGFRLKLCHQSAKTIALAGLKNKGQFNPRRLKVDS